MIIIKDIEKLNLPMLTATIGFFDGVHVGHRFLIEELKREARLRNLPSAVDTGGDNALYEVVEWVEVVIVVVRK